MLVVSDDRYPGWHASVDGNSADVWKVNTVVGGVVVGPGKHTITMTYRPFYFGLFCTLLGFAVAIVLQRRPEDEGPDVLG